MNANIEVIQDNAGGITIQNTATKAVAYLDGADKENLIASLTDILTGSDMSGWDTSEPECYVSDEEYNEHHPNGGYSLLDEDEIRAVIEKNQK